MKRSKRAFYTKKPVQIIAFQWFGHDPDEPENDLVRYFRLPGVDGESKCDECNNKFHVHGWIDTKEDGHRVCPNDWIIKGVAGEFYPCKPAIFAMTYSSSNAGSKGEE